MYRANVFERRPKVFFREFCGDNSTERITEISIQDFCLRWDRSVKGEYVFQFLDDS